VIETTRDYARSPLPASVWGWGGDPNPNSTNGPESKQEKLDYPNVRAMRNSLFDLLSRYPHNYHKDGERGPQLPLLAMRSDGSAKRISESGSCTREGREGNDW